MIATPVSLSKKINGIKPKMIVPKKKSICSLDKLIQTVADVEGEDEVVKALSFHALFSDNI